MSQNESWFTESFGLRPLPDIGFTKIFLVLASLKVQCKEWPETKNLSTLLLWRAFGNIKKMTWAWWRQVWFSPATILGQAPHCEILLINFYVWIETWVCLTTCWKMFIHLWHTLHRAIRRIDHINKREQIWINFWKKEKKKRTLANLFFSLQSTINNNKHTKQQD